jgi:predicted nucleotidyltransferase
MSTTRNSRRRGAAGVALKELLGAKREAILAAAARHGASNVRIFGSVARGEAKPGSDVDVLVELEPGRSLWDLGGLLMDLQDLLGCRVDVATEKSLQWYIRDSVLREAVPL